MRLSYWMTSRRLGAFLLLVGFVWCVTLMNMTLVNYGDNNSPEELRREILELSEKYVHKLAKETKHTVDGPYSGRLTGYDLKKTLAILLENMMDRVDNLEQRLSAAEANATRYNSPRPEPAQRQLQSKQFNPADAPVNAQGRLPQHPPSNGSVRVVNQHAPSNGSVRVVNQHAPSNGSVRLVTQHAPSNGSVRVVN